MFSCRMPSCKLQHRIIARTRQPPASQLDRKQELDCRCSEYDFNHTYWIHPMLACSIAARGTALLDAQRTSAHAAKQRSTFSPARPAGPCTAAAAATAAIAHTRPLDALLCYCWCCCSCAAQHADGSGIVSTAAAAAVQRHVLQVPLSIKPSRSSPDTAAAPACQLR
jgi:hypothetical protein